MTTRRRFLKSSAGAVIALPFLRSLAHANAAPPPRLVVFWETGGTLNNRSTAFHYDSTHPWNDWRPAGPPEAPVLGPLHTPLAAHLDRLLFVSGVDNMAEPGEHERADLSSLTATRALGPGARLTAGGPSIDQVLAARLAQRNPVPFASVDLTVAGPTWGEPSHGAAAAPIAREADPRAAFARLFGSLDLGADPAALARIRAQKRSVLDGALEGFRLLEGKVGATDRRILQAHQTHIRDIERRLDALDEVQIGPACAPPRVDVDHLGPPSAWVQAHPGFREIVAPLQVDLLAQALLCGLTNVATFHYPDTIEPFLPTPYQRISPTPSGHALGHVARELGDPNGEAAQAWRVEMQANRRWKVQQIARLMDTLGDALDHTLILHLSEFSNAAQHTARDLPILLAGNVGGLRTGRHITLSEGGRGDTLETHVDYKTNWSTHNLFTTMLRLFGFPDEHFGDGTATLRGPLPV